MRTRYPEAPDPRLLSYFVSGSSVDAGLLRYDLGIEVEEYPTAIKVLKRYGCKFEQTGADSYRLQHSGLGVWQDYLEYIIRSETTLDASVRVYQETSSTQDQAKRLAPKRAIVIANQQTAGRGRLGRSWVSNSGESVLMSICLPSESSALTHDRASMLAGVAVARAVEVLLPGITVRLKWPNDIMINGKKLAGILIEAVHGASIIGIGLNVQKISNTTPEINNIATCLAEHRSFPDRLYVIEKIIIELDKALRLSSENLMLDEWRSRAALGQTQTFEQAGQRITGEVLDLDPDHGLIVRRDTGEIVTLPAATTSVVK